MGTNPTKALDNIYCRCRKQAASYNDKLNSREGASELLGISVSSLADYELGNTKVVPVDKVLLMSDLYKAPEILNNYCLHDCPIGKYTVVSTDTTDIQQIAIQLHRSISKVMQAKEKLMDIIEDGIVTVDEKIELQEQVMSEIDNILKVATSAKMWYQKSVL